ncbi:hypothetical protein CALVIDRAFT_170938 [Calocera viscosa TUFC12733]|uniref:Secreted protein n=1 Tax=Calocera viscosa (strain TUFC12733) TaxID=1330018 RepID=A0A167L7S2_CALVF|nr:hypothetical protein CALVIDRAFT_170938 [Calocera viscosa TUFC12733]
MYVSLLSLSITVPLSQSAVVCGTLASLSRHVQLGIHADLQHRCAGNWIRRPRLPTSSTDPSRLPCSSRSGISRCLWKSGPYATSVLHRVIFQLPGKRGIHIGVLASVISFRGLTRWAGLWGCDRGT